MLEYARNRIPRGNFRKMDMLSMDFPDNSFDGIWCCASLLHVKKDMAGRAINEFGRVARKDGVVFISVREGNGETIKDYQNGTARFFANYSMDELEGVLSERGMRVVMSYRNTSDPNGETWLSVFARPG